MNDENPKPETSVLFYLGWLVAIGLFPAGPFLRLALAKVVSWPYAILCSIVSYAVLVPIMPHMEFLDKQRTPGWIAVKAAVILGMGLWFFGIAWYQYRLGRRRAHWSDTGRRIWRILGITAIVILSLNVLVTAARFGLLVYMKMRGS